VAELNGESRAFGLGETGDYTAVETMSRDLGALLADSYAGLATRKRKCI
jgi:hypothetical protein